MTMAPLDTSELLRVQPSKSRPAALPAMSNVLDQHDRVRLTSTHLLIDGAPTIPVSGEFHFSRVPRIRWEERLRLIRASGVTVVAAYIFWIHHQELPGVPRFDDNLDVAEFVRVAKQAGLHVVLRIGPWNHGEVRNGGLPDWVVRQTRFTRTDDSKYLSLVGNWFNALGTQLAPLCGPSSPIIAIQIENELYDQPNHIITLKGMAREAGLTAPLWTATAWGGAELPRHEVLPLYGGYTDGFWVDAHDDWDDTFRTHFHFSHQWDDPGIGADLRTVIAAKRDTDPEFPAATCELGGGMATAYHRRPVVRGRDIAAMANTKIGNGSAWQGFYMYAGGINPAGVLGMQESHDSGYPNDMPRFDYDFQAPISAAGNQTATLAGLREHNAFLEAFGSALTSMASALPEVLPANVRDKSTLRWALRGDSEAGFIFVNWHQPHEPLGSHKPVQFQIAGPRATVFPDEPIAIPAGTIARWPLGLTVGGVRIDWATLSAITVLGGKTPTLVMRSHHGIPAQLATSAQPTTRGEFGVVRNVNGVLEIGSNTLVRLSCPDGELDVLVLDEAELSQVWIAEGCLLKSNAPVWRDGNQWRIRASGKPELALWDQTQGRFAALTVKGSLGINDAHIDTPLTRPPRAVPSGFGSVRGRASAPTAQHLDEFAARYELRLPTALNHAQSDDIELSLSWSGDVAQLWSKGRLIADKFWDGNAWDIELSTLDIDLSVPLELRVLPLHRDAAIGFDSQSLDESDPYEESTPQVRMSQKRIWAADAPVLALKFGDVEGNALPQLV